MLNITKAGYIGILPRIWPLRNGPVMVHVMESPQACQAPQYNIWNGKVEWNGNDFWNECLLKQLCRYWKEINFVKFILKYGISKSLSNNTACTMIFSKTLDISFRFSLDFFQYVANRDLIAKSLRYQVLHTSVYNIHILDLNKCHKWDVMI